MKKYLLLLILLLIPCFVYAETCTKDKITISSITMNNKTNTVTELVDATANNDSIDLNISMAKQGDNIEYKIIVKNASKDAYVVDKSSFNINSKYIDYNITSSDNSNIIKSNSEKEFLLDINYKEKLSDSDYASGEYKEDKNMQLSLLTYSNPKTYRNLIVLIVISLMILITIYTIKNKKSALRTMVLFIGLLLIIPFVVYADCKYDILISSKIILEGNDPKSVPTGPYYNINKDKYYDILDDAVSSARSNQTIKVLEDTQETQSVTVSESLTGLKIDLNGNNINYEYTGADNTIINNGELEILNSSDEEGAIYANAKFMNNNILIVKENARVYALGRVVDNAGTLYVQGGDISGDDGPAIYNTGTVYMSGGSAGAYSVGLDNYNKAVITGGNIGATHGINNHENSSLEISGDDTRIAGTTYGIASSGILNINGGEITSTATAILNNGQATISNATITASSSSRSYNPIGINNNTGGTLIFNSGKIIVNATSDSREAVGINNKGTATILGGTIYSFSLTMNYGIGIQCEGTTTVLGGTITGRHKGINIISGGTLTLGKDDNNVDISSPTITAECNPRKVYEAEFAIYNSGGTFNYYDGLLKAAAYIDRPTDTSYIISGTITNLPNGYIVKKEANDGIVTAYLERE